jgi:hypothetical protein
MNAERLHAIAVALNAEMTNGKTVGRMQELITNLQNVVNQPATPHQQALSQSLKTIHSALAEPPSDRFSPAWREILREIDGEDFFGKTLNANIDAIFARNQITPAVALEELQQLNKRLTAFKNALDQITVAFRHLKIGDEKLSPGECEIGILIPRNAVSNQLLDFADELKELGFILNSFAEVATGKKDELKIRTISSSDLLVHLQAAAPYAACLAVSIERVIALYKQLLEIRKLREDIRKQGVPDDQTTGVEIFANQLMEKGIDKIAVEVVNEYHKKGDSGRKNELTNAIRISLNKIANRIDCGFNIEVRVEPVVKKDDKEPQDEEKQKAIAAIQAATANMQYLKLEGQPILKLPEEKKEHKKKE